MTSEDTFHLVTYVALSRPAITKYSMHPNYSLLWHPMRKTLDLPLPPSFPSISVAYEFEKARLCDLLMGRVDNRS